MLRQGSGMLDAIALPKASSVQDIVDLDGKLAALEAVLGLEVVQNARDVSIETASGLRRVDEILEASTRLSWVFFGPLYLAASLGMTTEAGRIPTTRQLDALMSCRLQVLLARRAAGVTVLDGPYFLLDDDGLRREAESVQQLGFDGKLTIHPAQIPIVNTVFTPTRTEF